MDTKSKILIIVMFLILTSSVVYMYKRYVIDERFKVFETETGIPEVEATEE